MLENIFHSTQPTRFKEDFVEISMTLAPNFKCFLTSTLLNSFVALQDAGEKHWFATKMEESRSWSLNGEEKKRLALDLLKSQVSNDHVPKICLKLDVVLRYL